MKLKNIFPVFMISIFLCFVLVAAGLRFGMAGAVKELKINQPPTISSLTENQVSVSVGGNCTMTCTASDPDGDTISYSWSQVSGHPITLSNTTTATATFSPGETGTYVFKLTVSDGNLTDTDSITINAQPIQSGNYLVDIYYKDLVADGTTLFGDTLDRNNPKLIEVDMTGQIVWQYTIPAEQQQPNAIGLDVDKLDNGNYLYLTGKGLYEIDSIGNLVWSKSDSQVSHDLQRLPNGDTIYVFGNNDTYNDAQVKQVNSAGDLVWSWYAKDHIPNDGIYDEGWTHTNAVTWQEPNSIYINLRNQYKTLKVDSNGNILWEMDWSIYGTDVDPHEPEIQDNGNMLICLQNDSPYVAVEINTSTKQEVWTYTNKRLRTARDADRLPNGNTLIVAVDNGGTEDKTNMTDDYSTMIEVNPSGQILWRLTLNTTAVGKAPGYFYKAQRLTFTPTPTPVTTPSPTTTSTPTPTPTSTGTPTPKPTPTSATCEDATAIEADPTSVTLQKKGSDTIIVTVTGENGCPVKDKMVKATIDKDGRDVIRVTPQSIKTDSNGEAVFTVTAKNKTGNTTVKFKAKKTELETTVSVSVTE